MIKNKKAIYLFKKVNSLFFKIAMLLFCTTHLVAQIEHSINVQAKVWSRDSARNIHYSNWKTFPSIVIDSLQGYQPAALNNDGYGGDLSIATKATGFFRTEKINNRWWIIDPLGHPFIANVVNGLRLGKSPNNEKAFLEKYKTTESWMKASAALLLHSGFNAAGSWSDVDAIIAYNKTTANQPLAYTTQLSLVPLFKKALVLKDSTRKKESELSLILDPDFASFCDHETKQLAVTASDPNLLGHFSDNELPFTSNEINNLLKEEFAATPGYQAAKKWMIDNGVTAATISAQQKDQFLGWIAEKYFSIVSAAIKKNDPNHLYIGSRLHASAKNNPFIFKAAEPYIDIISINYYGFWQPKASHILDWATWSHKPFFITEFYTKAAETGMGNMSGAGWLVKTQADRGIHYQNFCLELLKAKNCVGWHWFRYQDNDPNDLSADPSNNDSNKGIVNTIYESYAPLMSSMKQLNDNKYSIIKFFDQEKK